MKRYENAIEDSKSNYLILKLFQTSINLTLYSKIETFILQDMEL